VQHLAEPFYYLDNFRVMLETLQARDGDLLVPEELEFIDEFSRLDRPHRALLVRMIMRAGTLFRADRLAYAEIGDTGAAMQPLIRLGWVDDRPTLTLADLFRLFSKAQIVTYLGLGARRARESKAALMAGFAARLAEPQPYDECCLALGTVYGLPIRKLCDRLVPMFFGNFRQNLSEFVLADLGVFRYENAWSLAPSRPFAKRSHVDDFHRVHECREMLREGRDLATIDAAVPPPIAGCDWLEDRRQKLLFQIARDYERVGDCTRALELYSSCTYREAPHRRDRLRTAASGAPRLRRHRAAVPTFELSIERPKDGSSVEYGVRDFLLASEGEGTQIHYVENGLINSLFGLLCWPAIFAPIPGAFFHPFQYGPADLSSAGFFERRSKEFGVCFEELERGTYQETILRRFVDRYGTASPFVAWGLVDEAMLRMAFECIPAQHLALWFQWMVRDIKTNKAGFPDLVQFWPRERRYRLIEVKGPGDRLQDNQVSCLAYMLEHAMPVSVCRVRWL
jgi:VRR-NUC domain-containing protein/Fanconi-associated nuclease 1-like protein